MSRIIDHDTKTVQYYSRLYPFSDFVIPGDLGAMFFTTRYLQMPELKGTVAVLKESGERVGLYSGEVEHYLSMCGDDFYRLRVDRDNTDLRPRHPFYCDIELSLPNLPTIDYVVRSLPAEDASSAKQCGLGGERHIPEQPVNLFDRVMFSVANHVGRIRQFLHACRR